MDIKPANTNTYKIIRLLHYKILKCIAAELMIARAKYYGKFKVAFI